MNIKIYHKILVLFCSTVICTSVHAENLLNNPSFEKMRESWFSLEGSDKPFWRDFVVSTELPAFGRRSAGLRLDSSGKKGSVQIAGVVQELIKIKNFPNRLSGWYYIEDWHQGTKKQYLQVVVSLTRSAGSEFDLPHSMPIQLSYVLRGLNGPPKLFLNRKFIVSKQTDIVTNKWIYFNKDLHADFIKFWGKIPTEIDKIRVFFEVRYDDKTPDENNVFAKVYYDDLYLGY